MDFVAAFNALEAVWWTGLGIFCWWKGRGVWKLVSRTAALWLLLFAATEVIELQTGAWWRPMWLAAAKGVCLVGLTACGAWGLGMKRRLDFPDTAPPGPSNR